MLMPPKKAKIDGRFYNGKNRIEEIEDDPEELEEKCQELARLLRNSKCTIVYTGAGISTAASIPDYRGPNGIWTLAERGIHRTIKACNPVEASPTLSHMALKELYTRGVVQHVLSQNCDGFHLRSGLPQQSLSEIHGNMHVEVCSGCKPARQYIRSFDVTAETRYRRHATERRCDACNAQLQDTIVHFGENGKYRWPLNWSGAMEILRKRNCELILCLGSSLKILQKYEFLWSLDKPAKERPGLVVVNLQWTPMDRSANLKINGRCDVVMKRLMQILDLKIPRYCRECDPVLDQKRRSSRNSEMMTNIRHCTCELPPEALEEEDVNPLPKLEPFDEDDLPLSAFVRSKEQDEEERKAIPGWWIAGFQACKNQAWSSSESDEDDSDSSETSQESASSSSYVAKRKRGRPRKLEQPKKVRQKNDSESDSLSTSRSRECSASRKRGRPKKERSHSGSKQEAFEKRPRGRPRKFEVGSINQDSGAEKRGRGRPKKLKPVSVEDNIEVTEKSRSNSAENSDAGTATSDDLNLMELVHNKRLENVTRERTENDSASCSSPSISELDVEKHNTLLLLPESHLTPPAHTVVEDTELQIASLTKDEVVEPESIAVVTQHTTMELDIEFPHKVESL